MIFKSRIFQKQSKCIFCQSVSNQTAVNVNVLSPFLFATWGSSRFNLHARCSAPPIRGPQHEVPDHGVSSSIAVMSGYTRLAPHAIRDSNCILLGGSFFHRQKETVFDNAPLPQQSAKQSRQRVQKPTIVSTFSLLLTKTTDTCSMHSKNVKYSSKE